MANKLHLRDTILSSIGTVLIDTCFVFDGKRFESLVVKCINGAADWKAVLEERHWPSEEAARSGHQLLIKKWEV